MPPEYLAPGVVIEEIERGPKPIQAVGTSTAAFVGETERGPLKPKLITGFNEYRRNFGDVFEDGKYMPYAVKGFFDNGGRRCYVTRIVGNGAAAASGNNSGYTVTAVGPGVWGNSIFVRVGPGTTQKGGTSVGFRLQVFHWDSPPASFAPFDPVADTTSLPRPSQFSEDFDDLSLDEKHPNYWDKRVNNQNSSFVEVDVAAGSALPASAAGFALTGGQPGAAPIKSNFEGSGDTDPPTGLNALNLDNYREVAIVHAPFVSDDISKAVAEHCEKNKFRFAVLDSPANIAAYGSLNPRDDIQDTSFASFYYPWIYITDPKTGVRKKVPPGGFACGIYARSDNSRGVWKAPANETVAGALDLEFDIDHGKQEILNPRGVNCIRRFPGRGIRIWGARTLSSDGLWMYNSVRRLFIFLEHSIYNSTQWVVFEPNDQKLWARVQQTVTLFLRTQWREGALFGDKEEEAFSVVVGHETMTTDDILNGRLIIEVGIAPVRPAEFVIFRVFQKTQEAKS